MSIEQLQAAIRKMSERYPQVIAGKVYANSDSFSFTLESRNPKGEAFHRHYDVDAMMPDLVCEAFVQRSFSSMAGEVQKDIYA